jgi:hypothetical protein
MIPSGSALVSLGINQCWLIVSKQFVVNQSLTEKFSWNELIFYDFLQENNRTVFSSFVSKQDNRIQACAEIYVLEGQQKKRTHILTGSHSKSMAHV